MNPVLQTIHQRKSIRAYEDRPIPEELRQAILDAAMRAPTAGNMMLYSILEVSDQGAKNKLVETCDNQPFIAEAPLVLIFLADYQRWYDTFMVSGVVSFCEDKGVPMVKPEEGDLFLACCDALIAAQTAVIAAESFGIGSCYIGDILENYEIHKQMFDLPPYAVPIAMLCFGYPTEEQRTREQTSRLPQEFVVHKDRYRRFEAMEFERMFESSRNQAEAASSPRPNIGLQMYKRKFSAAFSAEMRRSVSAMLRSWTAG
ncbi:MAG: nitroreductase [Anaerolineales bacterium]|nr:MAG: nitroreductase [Anaerolineales bacterium]